MLVRSYLSEILDLIHHTGRRLSSVLALRFGDLRFDAGPQGGIRWRAEADKKKKAWNVPINAVARAALNRIWQSGRESVKHSCSRVVATRDGR